MRIHIDVLLYNNKDSLSSSLSFQTRIHLQSFLPSLIPISGQVPSFNPEFSKQGLETFKFIKAVSDTELDTINAVFHDKPLVLSRLFLTLY